MSAPRSLFACAALLVAVASPEPAAAGLFEMLFGSQGGATFAPGREPGAAVGPVERSGSRASRSGSQILCVRRCDGYYFPLAASASSTASADELCRAACPDSAAYRLSVRGPGETIDEARGPQGERYGDLPTAYAYRTGLVAGCGCHPPEGYQAWSRRLFEDTTLKRGDLVVTTDGASVFRGSGGAPPDASDFVDLHASGTSPSVLAQADRVLGFSFRADVAQHAAAVAAKEAKANEITVTATTRHRAASSSPRVILALPYSAE